MAATGIRRYFRLWKHVANPGDYLFHKALSQKCELVFTTKPFPVKFHVPESLYLLFKEIFMADVYEMDELAGALPAAPVVVDIGANAGFFVVQLLSKIKTATVYAYEPIPANVATFQKTIQDNPRLAQCVQLFQMAVMGQPHEHLDLFAEANDTSQVVASAIPGFNDNNTRTVRVPCITLTDILIDNNLQTIDLLKMDCEGSEYDSIYYTDPDLIRRIRKMVVEVHNIDGERNNLDAFNAYVQSLGYTTTYTPINSFCYALEAVRI